MSAPISKVIEYINSEKNQEGFIARLAAAVKFQSVSNDPNLRDQVIEMGKWLHNELQKVGVSAQLVELENKHANSQVKLPPLVVGRAGNDASKKTVFVYGHYDVQPATKSTKDWDTKDGDPFILNTELPDGRLVGRGSTDDKGPIMGWLNALEAHFDKASGKLQLPVNMRFCFEGMEESDSVGLDAWIQEEIKKSDGLFAKVDCVCISDNYWLNTRRPSLTDGLRGIASFSINISGPARDLHSGSYGRMIHEPMTQLIGLMNKLVDDHGKILVAGVENLVPPPTAEEIEEYKLMDYVVNDLKQAAGEKVSPLSDDPAQLLMGRMRFPSLSLHGIEGAYSGTGISTVIPANVKGKFSLRLVYPQTVDVIKALVFGYLNAEIKKLRTKNVIVVEFHGGGMPWVGNKDHWNFQTARAALETVYGKQLAPNYTREGGSIPIVLSFAKALGDKVNVMLLPMGRSDDGAHSTNEKLDKSNFINGSKVFCYYLHNVATVH